MLIDKGEMMSSEFVTIIVSIINLVFSLFALLISIFALQYSRQSTEVAAKAQQKSEEWREVDESRRQFIVQITTAIQHSGRFWEEESKERTLRQIELAPKPVTIEELLSEDFQLPEVKELPDFKFELLRIDLSLVNLSHSEKRLDTIYLEVDFVEARWAEKERGRGWVESIIERIPWSRGREYLQRRLQKISSSRSKRYELPPLITIQFAPPPYHAFATYVDRNFGKQLGLIPHVELEDIRTEVCEEVTREPISLQQSLIFSVESSKHYWSIYIYARSRLAKILVETMKIEPMRATLFFKFDDELITVATPLKPRFPWSVPSSVHGGSYNKVYL